MIDTAKYSHLLIFCDPSDIRPVTQRPNFINGLNGLIATNGHLCVVDATIQRTDEPMIEAKAILNLEKQYLALQKTVIEAQKANFNPAPNSPYYGKCPRCKGKGKHGEITGCDECDGEGEFTHGSHEYTCKECNGKGEVEDIFPDVTCENCNGTGQHKDTLTQIGDLMIQSQYYRKIMTLSDVVFYKPEGESNTMYFSHANGWGAVMPVRVD